MDNNDNIDLGSLLDDKLDDIEDLPEYSVPPVGFYKLLISKVESKKINDKPAMTVEYKVKETIQLAETTDAAGQPIMPPKTDTTFNEAFWFHAGGDIKKTKEVMKAKYGVFGTTLLGNAGATLNEVMSRLAEGNVLILANVTHQKDKSDHTKVYARTRDISLA